MGFRFDTARDAPSAAVAALRFWRPLAGYGLDPRPRTLPKSGEMGERTLLWVRRRLTTSAT